MKNIIFKFIFILLIIIFIIIVVNIFSLYFKSSRPKTTGKPNPLKTVSVSPPPYISPKVAPPVEAQIGTVTDVSKKPDGKIAVTVDKKTYLLPSDQKVKLYTSATKTTSVPISQIKKGTIVNVIKFTKPERYEVFGVTDKALVDKLL